MLNFENLKVGDVVIATEISCSNLRQNNKYTISYIQNSDSLYEKRVRLFENGSQKYYHSRFILDLKTSRKKKLEKLWQK